MIKYLVERMMLTSLRKAYRRVCWIGPIPAFDPGRPVVLYANHTTFHDGYVLWLVSKKLFNREVHLWMEEWDEFPLFAPVGARPFPSDDAHQRIRTIRHTAQFLRTNPNSTLIYFPEGKLHPPEQGILPFPKDTMQRLGKVLPDAYWWPVYVHLTTWGEAQPTLLITGGDTHHSPDGAERARLIQCVDALCERTLECENVLLGGKKSPDEAWNFSFLRPFFKRYLRSSGNRKP